MFYASDFKPRLEPTVMVGGSGGNAGGIGSPGECITYSITVGNMEETIKDIKNPLDSLDIGYMDEDLLNLKLQKHSIK